MPTKPIDLADGSTEEQIHQCYSASVDALYDHALKQDGEQILARVLTQALARMIVCCGSQIAAGAILYSLGLHVCKLVQEEVEVEVENAWKEEQLLH